MKHVLVFALTLFVNTLFSQDLTSRRGEPILPEQDDWAISMSVDPVFNFLGNAFSGKANNGKVNMGPQTIIAKKFIDDKTAYRGIIRVGYNNDTKKNLVKNDAQDGMVFYLPEKQGLVEDKRTRTATNIAIGLGKEFRRGKTRLQGYYGADILLWINSASDKYVWGNAMSDTSVVVSTGSSKTKTPTTTNFDGTMTGNYYPAAPVDKRGIKYKSGLGYGIGIRGFLGVDFFFLPKISVGAEYGWGIGFQSQSKGTVVTEESATTNGKTHIAKVERKTPGFSKFGFDTDINQNNIFGLNSGYIGSASIKVTFHF